MNCPVGSGPYSAAVGDLNRDGRPDIAVANLYSNTVSMLLGDGTGTFAPRLDCAAGAGPIDVEIADLNRDRAPDLLSADFASNPGGVSVLLNAGTP